MEMFDRSPCGIYVVVAQMDDARYLYQATHQLACVVATRTPRISRLDYLLCRETRKLRLLKRQPPLKHRNVVVFSELPTHDEFALKDHPAEPQLRENMAPVAAGQSPTGRPLIDIGVSSPRNACNREVWQENERQKIPDLRTTEFSASPREGGSDLLAHSQVEGGAEAELRRPRRICNEETPGAEIQELLPAYSGTAGDCKGVRVLQSIVEGG
ncbi:hypothetical protein [Microbacterium sorbitolivorans]|uniref:hypothetical protein n=1 Tax=Microbacterium sorbitolivorans TaxID=1867410 RepID=UPI0013B06B24|nr:hypothetical protein [Microbacterium sorbitolivorans]